MSKTIIIIIFVAGILTAYFYSRIWF